MELRSPLPGRVGRISKPNGSQVSRDDELLSLNSDEDSVWEALRGLRSPELKRICRWCRGYADSNEVSGRIKEQAGLAAKSD